MARGVALLMTNGLTYNGLDGDPALGNPASSGSASTAWRACRSASACSPRRVAAGVMLARTAFGRWLYASGGNARAAELSGVPVRRVQITVYVLSGICAAIAGPRAVLAAHLGRPDRGRLLRADRHRRGGDRRRGADGGRGTVRGTMLGAFVIGFLSDGLVIIGVSPTGRRSSPARSSCSPCS